MCVMPVSSEALERKLMNESNLNLPASSSLLFCSFFLSSSLLFLTVIFSFFFTLLLCWKITACKWKVHNLKKKKFNMVTHAILSPESTCQCTITHTGWPPEGSAGPPLQWQQDKKVTVPSLWVMFWKLQWPPSCSWNGIPSLVVALLLHSQNWNSKCWTAEGVAKSWAWGKQIPS